MRAMIHATAILAIAVLAAAATWWIKGPPDTGCDPQRTQAGQICIQDVPTDREVVWIDARSRTKWKHDGIAGSILWNNDPDEDSKAMEQAAVMKIFNTPYVIVYCADRGCSTSSKIADRIKELELGAEVYVLYNGWQALKDAGMTGPAKH